MSSHSSQLEAAIFQALIPNLEAQGYEVFVQPNRELLPPFMARHGYRPDAIAVKADKKLAIKVALNDQGAAGQLSRLQALFKEHADWELRVIYAPPRNYAPTPAMLPKATIERSLGSVLGIFEQFGPVTALLMGWSVFEAAARHVVPVTSGQPSPVKLVELLASEGIITPDQADKLRNLGGLRNQAAHGGLDVAVSREEIEHLVEIADYILGSTEMEQAAPA